MAITAKVDVFSLAAGNTTVDVQPAAGEVWLIKAFVWPGVGNTGNLDFAISLYDGTDVGNLIKLPNTATIATAAPGLMVSGTTTARDQPTHIGGWPEYSVIVTNTVRLRFDNGMEAVYVFGYSGVQLA